MNGISLLAEVLVEDDHGIMRGALTAVIEGHDGVRVLRSAASGGEASSGDVLHISVAGVSDASIAQHMSPSPKAIDTHRRLMSKLGVNNRSALIRFAIENELA